MPCINHPEITETQSCSRCNQDFCKNCLVELKGQIMCSNCKNEYLRELQTGTTRLFNFAGFWIRALAVLIDSIILGGFNHGLQYGIKFLLKPTGIYSDPSQDFLLFFLILAGTVFINYTVIVTYYTCLHGKYGQTLGKMVCRVKVINQDGSKISYLKAFARYWGFLLSTIILYIGCIMAAFDDEKKALHDRMCSTFVIHTR